MFLNVGYRIVAYLIELTAPDTGHCIALVFQYHIGVIVRVDVYASTKSSIHNQFHAMPEFLFI